MNELKAKSYKLKASSGFTLIEIMIFIGLSAGVLAVLGLVVTNIASLKDYFGEALSAEQEIQQTLTEMGPEIRSISQSNIGSYPIESSASTTLIFYSAIDQDGLFERVRYFLSGTTLKKGVIKPTGNPLQYVLGNEVVRDVVRNIVPGYDIFSYYDRTYTGTENPLTQPVGVSGVRLIRVTLTVNRNGPQGSGAVTLSERFTIRNLRDNQ